MATITALLDHFIEARRMHDVTLICGWIAVVCVVILIMSWNDRQRW